MPRSRLFFAGLCVALALAAAPDASAQTDRFPDLWSPDLRVEGMAVLGDTLFVAGLFGSVGPSTGQLAVLDKTTGQADTSYPPFDALSSPGITTVISGGDGSYYVGGAFSSVAEQPRRNLARVLPDGTLDPAFHPDPQFAEGPSGYFGYVSSLTLDRGAASPSGAGVLYIGGRFNTVAGLLREDLAAIDAATGDVLPLSADFVQTGTTRGLEALAVVGDVLYVAGRYSAIDGQPRTGLSAFRASTGTLLPWGPTLTVSPPASAPSVSELVAGESTLYVLGGFETVDGQPRPSLSEITLADPVTGEGGQPTAWMPARGLSSAAAVLVGNYIWGDSGSAGSFGRVDRTTGTFLAAPLSVTGIQSLTYDPVGGPSGQGTLYVGGQQPNASGNNRFPVVVGVDAATGQPTGYRVNGASEGGTVTALAVEPGPIGRLFAGGSFVTLGSNIVRRQGLAALDLTTGRPTAFAASLSGVNQGLFEDLALSPDGRVLYGYSNIASGASLRLTEFDLATGAVREFVPQGRTAATFAASDQVAEARRRTAAPRGSDHRGSSEHRGGPPNPRVENAGSAVVVTDTRVCVSLNGVACYDRASAALLFYTSMVYVAAGSEDNGNLLYLPPGGPFGNPGGADGALVLAAPVEEAPVGTVHAAFVAVEVATGDVIEDWDVGFGRRGPLGFAGTMLDPDGADGPARPALYLGGSFFETAGGPVGARQSLVAADPVTGAVRPWAPTVSGGTAAVLAMASHRTENNRGVVYVGGTLFFANGVRVASAAVAFDAVTGADLGWGRQSNGIPRVLLVSERLGAVFAGGTVGITGTGHANLAAYTPAAPILPTAGESGVAEAAQQASLALAGPNPLRSRTALAVSLPEAQTVRAELIDVLGRRVAVLHDGALPTGTSRIDVDASALPAGVYVVRVVAGTFSEALTLTVVR